MLFRATNYVSALLLLCGSMVVYQNVVTPWMQPPIATQVAPTPPSESSERGVDLSDLFPAEAWQLRNCKRLQTSDGLLLFENWQQVSDKQWNLWPITVVVGRGLSGDNSPAPVIIDAPQGAEIQFTESLDVMSGGAPPIERGRLVGSVRISKPSVGRSGGLDLQTSNVGIDRRKLWTTGEIKMQVGESTLLGRDLTLHLAGPAGGTVSNSVPVLDRMELIYLDQFLLPMQSRGVPITGREESPAKPALISIRCDGRVEYDFAIDFLRLNNNVSLVHQIEGALADRFHCQRLELRLNDPMNDSIARAAPLDWLQTIKATGNPASVHMPGIETMLEAETIDFNAIKGTVQASGQRGIRVQRGPIKASLAQLVYQFDPNQPQALGSVDVIGAGIVNVVDSAGPLRQARWLKSLKLRPSPDFSKDQLGNVEVWVDGQIEASMNDGGEFYADSIAGVLVPNGHQEPGKLANSTLVPDRFEIKGNVRVNTSTLIAQTKQMRLYFVDETDVDKAAQPNREANELTPDRSWVSQPNGSQEIVHPVARPAPTIRGELIDAQLRRNAEGLSAKNLSVIGGVEVLHQIETGGQSLPARLTGQRLQLVDGGGADILQLVSDDNTPARFELGDGYFVGPEIQVRPADNVVWINAAGEFQMPSSVLPEGIGTNQDGGLSWTVPPHCRWNGEMLFDGRSAVLTDGIEMTAEFENQGEPWELRLTGDRLQVDLQSGVSMRDFQSMRTAQMEQITLMQSEQRPVFVHALRRGKDGVLESKHLLHAKKMTLLPGEAMKLIGSGPGWYRGWSLPNQNGGWLDSAAKSNAMLDGDDNHLSGIHLIFGEAMEADFQNRQLDFVRGVRVGVRDIAGWDETFDATLMDTISSGESTLDCDRLRFNLDPTASTATDRLSHRSGSLSDSKSEWETEAIDGVIFRTRTERGLFEAAASRASYASSKDRFLIEGSPGLPAMFKQTLPDGSKGPEGVVRTITIRPSTMTIEDAVLERLNIATPANNGSR